MMKRQNRNSFRKQEPSDVEETARRGRAGAAGADLHAQAAGAFARAGFADSSLILRWREIAGEDVARMAVPVKLLDGPEGAVLTLRSEAGAALFLQHQSRNLIERLNLYLGHGRVARLRFVPGRIGKEALAALPDHPRSRQGAYLVEAPKTLSKALENLGKSRIPGARG